MKQFGVIGFPIEHSLSSDLHSEIYKQIKSDSYKYRCNTHPHNIYFELLSETGLLGLFFFLIIFVIIIKNIYKFSLLRKDPYISSSLSQLITIIWPFITSGSIISNFNGSFFWLNLGILIALIENKKNDKK